LTLNPGARARALCPGLRAQTSGRARTSPSTRPKTKAAGPGILGSATRWRRDHLPARPHVAAIITSSSSSSSGSRRAGRPGAWDPGTRMGGGAGSHFRATGCVQHPLGRWVAVWPSRGSWSPRCPGPATCRVTHTGLPQLAGCVRTTFRRFIVLPLGVSVPKLRAVPPPGFRAKEGTTQVTAPSSRDLDDSLLPGGHLKCQVRYQEKVLGE
jgi:hypothetical protein